MELVFDPTPPVIAATTNERGFPVRRLLCLGRNYADHAAEMGHAAQAEELPFFTKWAEAVTQQDEELPYPPETESWHFEVELVAAIGEPGAAIKEADALSHIWGYAVGVDMTRRDLQAKAKKAGTPWDWAKNGAATAPLGPIAPVSEVGHIDTGAIRLFQNDALRQDGELGQMIWSVGRTIAYISRFFPLERGDLIFTGTPAGVGPVARGDKIRAEIDGLPPLQFDIQR
ncbi:MAG: fumarylacetoacetate hydrolase family protein [Neomegalonema sp.]|nr:fumarylacetoacetate hydrolase family protein [Neomegalonema sp.]